MNDGSTDDRRGEVSDLHTAWRDLGGEDSGDDARTLAVVSTLRDAWRTLEPPVRRPVRRPLPLARVAAIAAALALATLALLRIEPRREVESTPPIALHPEWRLVADLTLASLASGSSAALLPVACLCCEALLLGDPIRPDLLPATGEVDQQIAAAIAADCRGDWSRTVTLLEPLLHETPLSGEQRTRAGTALSHAYRQLGRYDEAARAEAALIAAR